MNIARTRQLFIDDSIIESLENASRNLNQPTKYPGNPVLPKVSGNEPSWDAGLVMTFASVVFDEEEDIFRMWSLNSKPSRIGIVVA